MDTSISRIPYDHSKVINIEAKTKLPNIDTNNKVSTKNDNMKLSVESLLGHIKNEVNVDEKLTGKNNSVSNTYPFVSEDADKSVDDGLNEHEKEMETVGEPIKRSPDEQIKYLESKTKFLTKTLKTELNTNENIPSLKKELAESKKELAELKNLIK